MTSLIVFSETDKEAIRQDWTSGTRLVDIAKRFNICLETLRRVRRELGLPQRRGELNRWQENEDATLRANYGKISTSKIGELLGRSKNSVISRSWTLGLPVKKVPSATENGDSPVYFLGVEQS